MQLKLKGAQNRDFGIIEVLQHHKFDDIASTVLRMYGVQANKIQSFSVGGGAIMEKGGTCSAIQLWPDMANGDTIRMVSPGNDGTF